MSNDEILSLILSKLETLEQGQNELRTEVQSVKDEVQTIKLDVTRLEQGQHELRGEVQRLEQGQNELKADMQTVKKDVQMVKHDVKEISWKVDILYDWVDSIDNKVRNIDERTA